MQSAISESVQMAITPGECVDMYYPGKDTTAVQCYPAVVDNKFSVSLSLDQGSTSTVSFSPDQGVGDVLVTAVLPAPAGSATYANWAASRGWLYAMVDTISLRVGGGQQVMITGDQNLVEVLTECEDSGKRDAIFNLGGSEVLNSTDWIPVSNRTASIYVKLPFNSPSAASKPLPFPTDLLTQPVQITIQWKRFSDVLFSLATSTVTTLPTRFETAYMQFQQVHLTDSSHLLARRQDMNTKALNYPIRHYAAQPFKTRIQAVNAGDTVNVSLTGLQAGSLKGIDLWLVAASDLANGNPFVFRPPVAAKATVNGSVYYSADNGAGQLWSLVSRKTAAGMNHTRLADAGGGSASASAVFGSWTTIDFAQGSEPGAGKNELVLGLPVANATIQLSVVPPTTDAYILVASYKYAGSYLISRGTAELII